MVYLEFLGNWAKHFVQAGKQFGKGFNVFSHYLLQHFIIWMDNAPAFGIDATNFHQESPGSKSVEEEITGIANFGAYAIVHFVSA